MNLKKKTTIRPTVGAAGRSSLIHEKQEKIAFPTNRVYQVVPFPEDFSPTPV
jgi:hypothetical protein